MSKGIFKVGDICVGCNFVIDTELNGEECRILEGLQWREGIHQKTGEILKGWKYKVEWGDGTIMHVYPNNLKQNPPKRNDMDTPVKWEDMPWIPSELEVTV